MGRFTVKWIERYERHATVDAESEDAARVVGELLMQEGDTLDMSTQEGPICGHDTDIYTEWHSVHPDSLEVAEASDE